MGFAIAAFLGALVFACVFLRARTVLQFMKWISSLRPQGASTQYDSRFALLYVRIFALAATALFLAFAGMALS